MTGSSFGYQAGAVGILKRRTIDLRYEGSFIIPDQVSNATGDKVKLEDRPDAFHRALDLCSEK
jgi:hypothetical protein